MSRRNRHARHQHPAQGPRPRPTGQVGGRSGVPTDAAGPDTRGDVRPAARGDLRTDAAAPRVAYAEAPPQLASQPDIAAPSDASLEPDTHRPAIVMRERSPDPGPRPAASQPVLAAAPVSTTPAGAPADSRHDGQGRSDAEVTRPTCTVAQLRRFIKSRPWIPLHELRRRFGIYGGDDDVSPIRVGTHVLFIGLPLPESRLVAELLVAGDVGYELGLDPRAPIVVGVYPMRPVPRG